MKMIEGCVSKREHTVSRTECFLLPVYWVNTHTRHIEWVAAMVQCSSVQSLGTHSLGTLQEILAMVGSDTTYLFHFPGRKSVLYKLSKSEAEALT